MPPDRLLSQLPPPGNLKLNIQVVKQIGDGRVGKVYETLIRWNSSSSEIHTMLILSLMIKVSRPYDAGRLLRETFYHEEMECLQGSAIPRYYGASEATVPPDYEFVPWISDNRKAERKGLKGRRDVPLRPSPSRVGILILERLREYIPLSRSVSQRE